MTGMSGMSGMVTVTTGTTGVSWDQLGAQTWDNWTLAWGT